MIATIAAHICVFAWFALQATIAALVIVPAVGITGSAVAHLVKKARRDHA